MADAPCSSAVRARGCSACPTRCSASLLYALLALGLLLEWPAWLLFAMTLPAVAMSAVLGLQPDHAPAAVPHLLDRACRQRDAAALTLLAPRDARLRRRVAAQAADPDALYEQRENIASAQQAEGDLGGAPGEGSEGLRVGVEARARALLARHARAGEVAEGLPRSRASPPAAPRSPPRRTSPKGTSGSRPTWARSPSRSACGRA